MVERTCAILREVSRHGQRGARLIDVTQATGLSRPTAHRILNTLVGERFIRRTAERRYQLGSVVYEMGLNAPSPMSDLRKLREIVQALADECGDTVYLAMRRGDQAHYLLRCEGAYPVRTHVVSANQTLHLVSGHSGRALLGAMSEEEAEDIILRAMQTPSLFHETDATGLREEIDMVRRKGFGWARDVTFVGVAGLTVPVPNPNGASYLALTISSISQRLTPDRAKSLLPLLQATSKRIVAACQEE
nr:IclR family transcriptional regulator [Rhizobium sp. ACO-34A]